MNLSFNRLITRTSVRARIVVLAAIPVLGFLVNGIAYTAGEQEVAGAFRTADRASDLAEISREFLTRAMAGIPTAAEAGYPMEVSIWNGLWAPKGTPQDIIDKLNAAAVTALADPAVRKRMEELGQDLPTPEEMKPASFAAFQKAELGRWKPILDAAGVKAE